MKSKMFMLALLASGTAAIAAEEPREIAPETNVHDFRPAAVPLVAEPLDLTQKSDRIWVKGDKPASNKIASLTLRPVAAAVVEEAFGEGYGAKLVMPMALTGSPESFATLKDAEGPADRLYCDEGRGKEGGKILCLLDKDKDGRFDHRALGLGEAGVRADQLSVVGKPEPLEKPVAYRMARPEELPKIDARITNCGKDHDRPRYSFATAESASQASLDDLIALGNFDSNADPVRIQQQLAYFLSRGNAACKAGDQMSEKDNFYPASLASGAVAARLGELAIEVGSKDSGAPVRLLGLREPQRLYRLVRAGVVPFAETVTEKQNALAIVQKFDKPVLVTTADAKLIEGERKVGDEILTAGFAHGYMGVLTQDTKIKTLLSSRSLSAGTILYGMPMASQVVTTMNGVPIGPTRSSQPTPEQVHLIWCVPVEEETKWSATCLPTQGDRYTLLKGQYPAFEVQSLRYGTGTSTNDGEVPVAEQAAKFERPLSYRFKLKALSESLITLSQETLYGDEIVYSRDHRIPRVKGGSSGLSYGKGTILFTDGASGNSITVKKLADFAPGVDARVTSGLVSLDMSKPVPAPPSTPTVP